EGIVRDFSAYEEEWVWKVLESRLEAVERMDGNHPKVREFQTALEELREKSEATVQDYRAVLAKAEAAALWTSVEARIDLYGEMLDSAGMTDGIIHLGKKALGVAALMGGGPLAYEAYRENSESDIDGASAYLEMQTRYIAVHRALTEGAEAEARKLFIRLENSQEHAGLLEGYKDSQRVNQCTVTAAIVTASAATAGIATELIGGAAAALGLTRGLSLLKFGTQAAAFTVAERGYSSWVYDKNFFDPQLSFTENARDLGWEMALNAGMFAFLGRAFHAFEKHLVLPLARARVLSKVGGSEAKLSAELIRSEREILLNQLGTGIPLRLGRFGAELLAFGQWEAIAQNLELNRENLRSGKSFQLVLPTETLFSLQAWEERFVFLIALKAGGLLAAPIVQPIQQRLARWTQSKSAVDDQAYLEAEAFFRQEGGREPSYWRKIFRTLPRVGGGHDGPQKPKAGDIDKYVEMYESGEEAAGLRGLVELAEQGLPEAVVELVLLKLGPKVGDRGKIQEAMASIRVEAIAERAPEDYLALRSLLELAASNNEAAREAAASASLAALRERLVLAPKEETGSPNFNADLSDFLLYGNREAAEILFGKYRHEIHPEHLANWEEKILREGRLNYRSLSPQNLLQLAREGRKDVLFGLLEMAQEQASPTIRGMLNLIFFEETASILIDRIRWLRGELGPTAVLEYDLQSTPADHVRRVARFAPYRADAQRALLELANAGHPEALRELAELPLNGVLEDGQEVTLFVAEPVAFGLAAWKYIGFREGRLTFKKVRMHASEPAATLRLSGIQEPISVLKPGSQYYFLEKNDADPLASKTDPSPFALPFMIFGPGSLLMRGFTWLWNSLQSKPSPQTSEAAALPLESSPAHGWAWNEAGLHYFDYPRRLHLTDEPSAFSEKKYGRWRALGFQVWKGKSILLLQKQRPATEAQDSDTTQEYMYFESSAPLRRMMKEDGNIYLVGEEVSLRLDADLYFYPEVSGGSDSSGGDVKQRIAQRIFAGNGRSVPSNSLIPQPTALREIGGREFLLKTRRVTEAQVDVTYSAILLDHQDVQGDAYRQSAEIRLTFGIFENAADFRYHHEHGVPRRSLTLVATREEAQRLGFEYDAAGNLLSQTAEQNWVLKEKAKPGTIRGEWRVPDSRPDPEFPPLQAEYALFAADARVGSVVMLGRGRAPAGFKKQFIPISDPVVRRRHLLLRRRSEGEVELQAIPPNEGSLDRENRKAFWVEMEGTWLPLPADLPFVLQPGQRFALGHVTRPPRETSQALVFRLSADGNSLLLD
ncbi:MAG TPA: hypothetical protein VJP40_04405, partial [bacterium]|nr:hypothetical protein [bacterium]